MPEVSIAKYYSGHRRTIEEEGDQTTLGRESWENKCGQQASSTAGEKCRRQYKTELDGQERSMSLASTHMPDFQIQTNTFENE